MDKPQLSRTVNVAISYLESSMNFHIEIEREDDGRWIAEVPEIPGVLAYGVSAQEAQGKAEALAFRALAERIESGDNHAMPINIMLAAT